MLPFENTKWLRDELFVNSWSRSTILHLCGQAPRRLRVQLSVIAGEDLPLGYATLPAKNPRHRGT